MDYNKNIICWSINISKILNDLELWHDLCKSAVKCSLWSNRIHLKLLTSDLKSTSKFTFSCSLHPRVDFNIHILYIILPPVDSKIQVLVLTSSSSRLQNSRFYSDFFLVCSDLYPQILTNFVVIYWTILNNVFDWPLLHIRAEQIKKHTRVNIQQLKKRIQYLKHTVSYIVGPLSCCEFDSYTWRGVLDTVCCDYFSSDLRQFIIFSV